MFTGAKLEGLTGVLLAKSEGLTGVLQAKSEGLTDVLRAKSDGLTRLCSGGCFRNSYVFHDIFQK